MSRPGHSDDADGGGSADRPVPRELEAIPNEDEGTVTFTPVPKSDVRVAGGRWLTVDVGSLVDVREWR